MLWDSAYDHSLSLSLSLLPSTFTQVNRVVERRPLKCTHFDATRHFPKAALAMNRIRPPPGPHTRLEQEQPGCLHTNCDLFKWATQVRKKEIQIILFQVIHLSFK